MSKFLFNQFQNVEIFVKNGKPWGGSVVQTYNWMLALHNLDQEVALAIHEDEKRELKDEFKWLEFVPFFHPNRFKKRLVWFSYRFPSVFLALRKWKPDFVYSSIPTWRTLYYGLICRVLGIKHVIRIANDPDVDKTKLPSYPKIFEFQINLAYRLADVVLAQNNFQYLVLEKFIPQERLFKIANPIVLNQNYLKKKPRYEGFLAWLANFRHQKNLALLYEIAISLPDEKIKIAGEPLYPLDEETEEFYGKLQQLGNVEFVGVIPRNQVLDFLSQAKFLLNTSRYEGFSNTFLESMVTGTPILTTPNVNPDGIIDQFALGFLYQDQMGLKAILNNIGEQEYFQVSYNCVEYVKENHDHIHLGKKLLTYLQVEDFQKVKT